MKLQELISIEYEQFDEHLVDNILTDYYLLCEFDIGALKTNAKNQFDKLKNDKVKAKEKYNELLKSFTEKTPSKIASSALTHLKKNWKGYAMGAAVLSALMLVPSNTKAEDLIDQTNAIVKTKSYVPTEDQMYGMAYAAIGDKIKDIFKSNKLISINGHTINHDELLQILKDRKNLKILADSLTKEIAFAVDNGKSFDDIQKLATRRAFFHISDGILNILTSSKN